ncbi:MAG: hypothetical protein KC609_16650 [Myxococcales bacterium]|nr:hypothetical protein [Myxococcales bacterium]
MAKRDEQKPREMERRRDNAPPREVAERLIAELAGLVRRLAERHPDYLNGLNLPDRLSLTLEVPLNGAARGSASQVIEQIDRELLQAVDLTQSVRLGSVFCFQCRRSDCEHAQPSQPDSVFAGYLPTGKPTWQSLSQLCLTLEPAQVDKLYRPTPELVFVLSTGRDLRAALLDDFGGRARNFVILGQLALGHLVFEEQKRALSIQAVLGEASRRRRRLDLNLCGLDRADLHRSRLGPFDGPALREVLRRCRYRLAQLRRGREIDVARLDEQVLPILTQLKGELERLARRERRNTQHVRERAREDRPTTAAMRDLEVAAADRFFRDLHEKTAIVLGPKGRVHVFSFDGRHVTSMKLDRESVLRRQERGRWVALGDAEIEGLRQRLSEQNRLKGAGED